MLIHRLLLSDSYDGLTHRALLSQAPWVLGLSPLSSVPRMADNIEGHDADRAKIQRPALFQ